ncbi:DNA-formamidopyrimidine glycosylase [Mycoplasmoides genitalium]|uniref:Formamidopyrimidine-DNA glycosylase n=2 Tax=Mycoplasmoides genitalium TaxID=2097 RepID=FPG_MYCGE|nr:DNA-formamidopyrimidine glycosylase [Mycoplasmoides genitalium]P55825.3 RecName: Full=Formamidopyrimidine-DNA glycosylase; Short=Fapy-DNA glycosylase; AltName: Full=DNA-(apurinic or apyrimidinic site) lyase MutM; Short=AP lyase MutM [Mycoplasmoides genitalium G37]ABY79498.1 formamidopyrimidine-DNA glycosylase [synthetic Mycoplasma genitalium JCVI-1.0]AAC71484.1 formamidopyrimidine-DNA glycosylase [Mycoplasmoides genitalium G37]AFQ03095.1 formamidopyrimidine/5-formyluracil/ 5-hydroxymethylura
MPELPEVTTVINELKETVLNKPLDQVQVNLRKVLKNIDPQLLNKQLKNQFFTDIKRKGKYIIFLLSNGLYLVSHLRMEGKYFFEERGSKFNQKHVLVEFHFDDGSQLNYHDTRQFGTFHLYEKLEQAAQLNKLAFDPLEAGFDYRKIFQKAQNSKRKVKTFILDQTVISGIGNIYADEILFASKINPETMVDQLTIKEIEILCKNATKILAKAIVMKGTTISSFSFKKDHTGGYQNFLKVHTKKDQPCSVCNQLIVKKKINGRGSYFCLNCQKITTKVSTKLNP